MEQFDLSDFFQTRAQATDFSSRLSVISEAIYETGFNLETTLMEQFGIHKKDKFISFLRDNNINPGSNSALKAAITQIQEKINTLPVISLLMAVEPDQQILKSLSDWMYMNVKKQVLFDIRVDPNLIGGATVTYGGKYVDFSIKPVFDAVLKEELAHTGTVKNTQIDYAKYHATALNDQLKEYLKNNRYSLVN